MNKLSKLLNIAGISIIAVSIIRYFFIWYDPSQAILGVLIGIIFIGFGDIYQARRVLEDRISKVNERLDAFSKWFGKKELN